MNYILVQTEIDYLNIGTEVELFDNPNDCYAAYLKRKEHWNEYFDNKEAEQYFEEGPLVNEDGDEVDCIQQWTDESENYVIRLEIFERD